MIVSDSPMTEDQFMDWLGDAFPVQASDYLTTKLQWLYSLHNFTDLEIVRILNGMVP